MIYCNYSIDKQIDRKIDNVHIFYLYRTLGYIFHLDVFYRQKNKEAATLDFFYVQLKIDSQEKRQIIYIFSIQMMYKEAGKLLVLYGQIDRQPERQIMYIFSIQIINTEGNYKSCINRLLDRQPDKIDSHFLSR